MRNISRILAVGVAVTCAQMLFAETAQASTLVANIHGKLAILADQGRENHITIRQSGADYVITDTGDTLEPGTGCLKGYDPTKPTHSAHCSAAGLAHIEVWAGDRNDSISNKTHTGSRLLGQDGNDGLGGGVGNDRLEGGAGNDNLDGGPGNDNLVGGAEDDDLLGGPGSDRLEGGYDNDIMSGEAGNDNLKGQDGDDILWGGAEADDLDGGIGNDSLDGQDGDDGLDGGVENDRLFGGAGNDALFGRAGADRLNAGAGIDALFGQAGRDRLNARDGVRGNDVADGGGSRDICSADRRDVVRRCP